MFLSIIASIGKDESLWLANEIIPAILEICLSTHNARLRTHQS